MHKQDAPTPLWIAEFGPGWQVPAELDALVAADKIAETSWHNDVGPSYVNHATKRQIWIAHPTRRESPEQKRFTVTNEDADTLQVGNTLYEGDDLTEAIAALLPA